MKILSNEHAWQLSQEFRLASSFSGPLNFSVGGNYLHYETEENYYVFFNALTAFAVEGGHAYANNSIPSNPPGSNSNCLQSTLQSVGYQHPNPITGGGEPLQDCIYIDTNPLSGLNNEGHNYFLAKIGTH